MLRNHRNSLVPLSSFFRDDDRRNGGGREISLGKGTELHDVTITSTPVVRTTIGLHRTRPAHPRRELHWCFPVFGSSLHRRLPLDPPRGASPLPIAVRFPSTGPQRTDTPPVLRPCQALRAGGHSVTSGARCRPCKTLEREKSKTTQIDEFCRPGILIGVYIAAAAIVVVDQLAKNSGFELARERCSHGNVASLDDSGPHDDEVVLRRDPREVLACRHQGQLVPHAKLRDERSHHRHGDSTTTVHRAFGLCQKKPCAHAAVCGHAADLLPTHGALATCRPLPGLPARASPFGN